MAEKGVPSFRAYFSKSFIFYFGLADQNVTAKAVVICIYCNEVSIDYIKLVSIVRSEEEEWKRLMTGYS